MKRLTSLIGVLCLASLAACEDDAIEAKEEPIRAIKTFVVSDAAGDDVRRYSGSLAASATSALSFAVSGTVATVGVKAGDAIEEGQVLATLDPARFEYDQASAQAEVDAAAAAFAEKSAAVERQKTLFAKGWVAKAALEQAEAGYESAEGQLNLARSRLATAERVLGDTTLRAPFAGLVASRDVEPFQEASVGKPVFRINAARAFEVDLAAPDAIISRISVGASVAVDVGDICGCAGRVAEIGAASGAANAVDIVIAIADPPDALLPGMTAEAALTLSSDHARGFLVPINAIAAGDEAAVGYVYIFDAAAGAVRRTAVRPGDAISGNLVSISEGVSAGDVIASAGVSFLRDGQRVKRLGE